MAIGTITNTATFDAGNVTTINATYPSDPTAGNLLVCGASGWAITQSSTTGVADNSANGAWTQAVNVTMDSEAHENIWFFENTATTASFQVTATFNAQVNGSIGIGEVSGAKTSGALDATNSGTGSSTTPSSGSASPTGTVLYVGLAGHNGSNTSFSVGSGWTQAWEVDEDNTNQVQNCENQVGSGAKTADWTLGASRSWGACIATFQEEAGGAPGEIPIGTLALMGVGI